MTLKLYGWARSRARRCIWMLKELGVEWEHDPVSHLDPRLKEPEFRKLSPEGRVPVLVDGDFALDESLVINLYLAKTYGTGRFYPEAVQGEALCWRWTVWGQSELEGHLTVIFHNRALKPEPERVESLAVAAEAALQKPLAALEAALDGRDWLVGEGFSVADLNVAAILAPNRAEVLNLEPFENVRAWLARCYGRPAAVAALAMAA